MSELKYKKEWRQLGLVPKRGEVPRRIRRFDYGGEGHLYAREQMRPLQVHRKPIPRLVEATVANVLLACFIVTRTAKRFRDAATRCYEARAFNFATRNRDRKDEMYDLKANALCWLIARGAVEPEGLVGSMTVWRGSGYCFHSPIGPVELETLSAESVFVEAKPKAKDETRLIDAVALLQSLPDEPLPDGMIWRDLPSHNKKTIRRCRRSESDDDETENSPYDDDPDSEWDNDPYYDDDDACWPRRPR
jgi:hypothetical protein